MPAKDFRAIARQQISSPSKHTRPPRLLVYSRNKKGKSRFCTTPGKGKVLIIDPEGGTDEMKTLDPDTWKIDRWEDLTDVYGFLRLKDHDYEWVAFDGLTRIANMALRFVQSQAEERSLDTKPSQTQLKAYGQAGELVKGLLINLHALPVGLIFTAQERIQELSTGDEEDDDSDSNSIAYVPDLPKGVRSFVNSMVDVIGRLYVVKTDVKARKPDGTIVVKQDVLQRRLWIEPTVTYDTGYRSDHVLPPYIKNPTVARVVTAIREGK